MRTDGRTDRHEAISLFRNFVNAPKTIVSARRWLIKDETYGGIYITKIEQSIILTDTDASFKQ